MCEYSEYRVEAYHPFGRPCDASGPYSEYRVGAPCEYSEYPSGALCEYSEYPSGALCEYSEYRMGAYQPFGRPTAAQGTTRGAARALHRRQSSQVLWVLTGTQGTLRMLYSKGSPQAPEVHSPTMALEELWAVGGGYGRQGYSGYSRSR